MKYLIDQNIFPNIKLYMCRCVLYMVDFYLISTSLVFPKNGKIPYGAWIPWLWWIDIDSTLFKVWSVCGEVASLPVYSPLWNTYLFVTSKVDNSKAQREVRRLSACVYSLVPPEVCYEWKVLLENTWHLCRAQEMCCARRTNYLSVFH